MATKAQLLRAIKSLPGYDPYRDAGDCTFDVAAAKAAVEFIERMLTFSAGPKARQPFILEQWQVGVVANLWGWKRPDGSRRYRRCMVYVPRKNGKSELAAAIVLLALFCDGEPSAQIYSAAAKRDQTGFVFNPVKGMIAREPILAAHANVFKYQINVGGGYYRALAAEATSEHGGNTHLAVIDELHAQPDRELVDVLETSTIARQQPLIVYLTTADFWRESICNEKYQYAKNVRDGTVVDPTFLPVVYEASREDDWTDPDVWYKANPNLGVTITEDALREQCEKAKATPAFVNTFLRLHLNVQTEADVRLIDQHQWKACIGDVNNYWLRGRPCVAGLDLATVKDLAALVLVFWDGDGGYTCLPWFWCPREEAERRDRKNGTNYMGWARQGLLELTDGNSIDYRAIRQKINELGQEYAIQEIGYDPYNASHLVTELAEEDGFEMTQVRQGMMSMSPPTKLLLRLLLDRKLSHGGHPVLTWCAMNANAKEDHIGNMMPDKAKSGEKIDGLVALIVGLSRAMVQPGSSIYDRRGPRWI